MYDIKHGNDRIVIKSHFIFNEGTPLGYYLSSLVTIIFILAYIVIRSFNIISDKNFANFNNILSIFAALVFFLASAWGLYKSINLKIRNGIILFLICSFFYLMAEMIWAVYYSVLNIEIPYPSFADIFYVLASITLISAIYYVTKGLRNKPKFDYSLLIVILVAAIVYTIIFFYLSHSSVTDIYKNGRLDLALVLDIGYPVLDIIALVMVARLLEASQGRKVFESQMMLAGAISLMSFSDIYFSVSTALDQYSAGSLTDYLYVISYLLFALSVWRYVSLTRKDIAKDVADRSRNKPKEQNPVS